MSRSPHDPDPSDRAAHDPRRGRDVLDLDPLSPYDDGPTDDPDPLALDPLGPIDREEPFD